MPTTDQDVPSSWKHLFQYPFPLGCSFIMANIRFYSLINEAASKCNIDAEKQCTQCNQKPIKVVQMISIQVVSKPTLLLASATEFFNNGNKETAQETMACQKHSNREQYHASHSVRHLIIKVLLQSYHGKHI